MSIAKYILQAVHDQCIDCCKVEASYHLLRSLLIFIIHKVKGDAKDFRMCFYFGRACFNSCYSYQGLFDQFSMTVVTVIEYWSSSPCCYLLTHILIYYMDADDITERIMTQSHPFLPIPNQIVVQCLWKMVLCCYLYDTCTTCIYRISCTEK